MYYWSKYRIKKADNGVAAIEFALLLPVLLATLIGMFDVADLVFCTNKMNRTAQQISNLVTRGGNLTQAQMNSLLQVTTLVAQPFNFSQSGNVIVTSVAKQTANLPPQIMWQRSFPGGTGASRIVPGNLPGGLVLNLNQTVIFTEVFFTYQPLVPGYVISSSNTNIYALAAGVPRQGTMTTPPS